jgi:hypothetical protein
MKDILALRLDLDLHPIHAKHRGRVSKSARQRKCLSHKRAKYKFAGFPNSPFRVHSNLGVFDIAPVPHQTANLARLLRFFC